MELCTKWTVLLVSSLGAVLLEAGELRIWMDSTIDGEKVRLFFHKGTSRSVLL